MISLAMLLEAPQGSERESVTGLEPVPEQEGRPSESQWRRSQSPASEEPSIAAFSRGSSWAKSSASTRPPLKTAPDRHGETAEARSIAESVTCWI